MAAAEDRSRPGRLDSLLRRALLPPALPSMPGASAKPFRHAALFYDGDASFLSGVLPFVRKGLAAGEPVLVALGPDKTRLLSDALGSESRAVAFADMDTIGANPARIIPALRTFLDQAGSGPARGLGAPVWSDCTEDQLVECQLHEALVNRAFADANDFELLCPYDTTALPIPVLQEACCNHPVIALGEESHPSRAYRGADALPPAAQAPLRPPPPSARTLGFDRHNLAEVRALTADCAGSARLRPAETAEFVLGVHELAANSVRHAGGIGVLRAWVEDGAAVCEVRDSGHIEDLLAGRRAPRSGQLGGWGLWLVNTVSDLVQIRTATGGTVVRVRRSPG